MDMEDPRDNFAGRPNRVADVELFGDGAPPEEPPGWNDNAVVHRELFFETDSSPDYPRGWWVLKLWRGAA